MNDKSKLYIKNSNDFSLFYFHPPHAISQEYLTGRYRAKESVSKTDKEIKGLCNRI